MAMAESYDPAILSKLVLEGLKGDVAKAMEWYKKAKQLGNGKAGARLDALGQQH
jgi:hypothetical protein